MRLELIGITKRYPGVVANDAIDLRVAAGRIHAVLGENGAGKSTLMKIIDGQVRPDAGEMRFNGQRVQVRSPHDAQRLGIRMVHQHFSLFESLTVAQNVALGLDRHVSLAEVRRRIAAAAADHGLAVEPERPVYSLSVGERQRVEIVRALLGAPQLLILDEPTSVLTPQAVQQLFATLRRLAASGCAILYISHKLDEIRDLCERCTVLRAGRVCGDVDPRTESPASLARLMLGAEPPALARRPAAAGQGAVALAVRGLRLASDSLHGTALDGIDLHVRSGEIVGVAGVSGNGQQELLAALSGEDRRAAPGSITLYGADIAAASPGQRRDRGLRFVPEERLGRAAVPSLSLADNLLLTRTESVGRGGWLRRRQLTLQAADLIRQARVKARGPTAAAQSLSGGNLQKFIVGREIGAKPRVLVIAQPTWGVDVGAAVQIRQALLALREGGCAVLVVSEDLDELFEIADRLVVMARGRLSPPIAREAATLEQVGQWMGGQWSAPPAPAPGPSKDTTAHAAA